MALRILVDRERCSGHGRCFDHCPDLFVPDVEGFPESADFEVPPEHERGAVRAAEGCPERAIAMDEVDPAAAIAR